MSVIICRKLKKGWIALCAIVFVAILLVVTLLPTVAFASKTTNSKTVVLDAGHGGVDVGVCGVRTGVKESELNLKIAFLVGEYLQSAGFDIVYTRTNDTMHTYPGITNNRKRADMFARRDIINSAQPLAVVSIHMNFYSSSSRRGAQVFYDKNNEQSKQFAQMMQTTINDNINSIGNGRKYSPLSADKFLLSCTQYATIIVECGFLSNPFDEQNLCKASYQCLLAQTISNGIISFLSV